MNTQFTQNELIKLIDFVGYGNLNAPLWFIGMEERGSDLRRLKARLKFTPTMDLKKAHQILDIHYHHAPPYKLQPTWTTMCRIVLTLKGVEPTRKELQAYQAHHLGRSGDRTMMTELLPLPAPATSKWPYKSALPQFPSRKVYKLQVRPPRIRLLSGLIDKYHPTIVVCYGKGAWHHFRDIFPGTTWLDRDSLVWGRWHDTHVFLTPHFARGYMSKESVSQLCERIRDMCPKILDQL